MILLRSCPAAIGHGNGVLSRTVIADAGSHLLRAKAVCCAEDSCPNNEVGFVLSYRGVMIGLWINCLAEDTAQFLAFLVESLYLMGKDEGPYGQK